MAKPKGMPTPQAVTPRAGHELAIKLSRMAVKSTQSSDDIRRVLRKVHERAADVLIASSHLVAAHFATITAANDYWRTSKA